MPADAQEKGDLDSRHPLGVRRVSVLPAVSALPLSVAEAIGLE
jgi:hypothetical protein